jgi:hypothetical protein
MKTHCAIPDGEFLHNSVPGVMPTSEANSSSASQEIPLFYGARKFNTAFTRTRHFYLSWARQIQSMSTLMSWESILILSLHVRLGFPIVSFPQVTLPKPCMHLSFTSYGLRDEFAHLSLNSGLKGTRGHGTANTNWIALCDYFNMKDQNHSKVSFAVFRGSLSLWTQI